MVRTIVTPTDTDLHISIAKEYVGKTLEITYLSLDELEHKPASKKKMSDFWNTLSDTTAQEILQGIDELRSGDAR